MGARAEPNAEADIRVRLADPNGQKADEIAVRLGRPVGVALSVRSTPYPEQSWDGFGSKRTATDSPSASSRPRVAHMAATYPAFLPFPSLLCWTLEPRRLPSSRRSGSAWGAGEAGPLRSSAISATAPEAKGGNAMSGSNTYSVGVRRQDGRTPASGRSPSPPPCHLIA